MSRIFFFGTNTFVPLEYHDYSTKGPDWIDNEVQKQSLLTKRRHVSFPMKLYDMLEQSEWTGLSNIVTFQPHGRSVLIKDREQFPTVILPRFFPDHKHTSSFIRQMNLYGFLRMTKTGPDHGS